jgi:hypothetical protein
MLALIVSLGVVAVLLFVGWRVWLASKGVPKSLEELRSALQQLLEWGRSNGFIVITPIGSNSFLQFNKYMLTSTEGGLELSFPRAGWSRQYFSSVERLCDREAINYRIEHRPDSHMEFLTIDCKNDIQLAHKLAAQILTQVFRTPDAEAGKKFRVLFYNIRVAD